MNVPQTHLLEYLGAEETNLLVNMNLCKRDMDFFPQLDGLFQEPLKYIDLKIKNRAELTHDAHAQAQRRRGACRGYRKRRDGAVIGYGTASTEICPVPPFLARGRIMISTS